MTGVVVEVSSVSLSVSGSLEALVIGLSGPAGSAWEQGGDEVGGEVQTIARDAIEFARIVSGRAQGDGLLGARVVF